MQLFAARTCFRYSLPLLRRIVPVFFKSGQGSSRTISGRESRQKKIKSSRQMLDAAHGVAECSIRDRKRLYTARTECKSTHASFARNTRRRRQVPAAFPDFRQGSRGSSAEARSRRSGNRSNERTREFRRKPRHGLEWMTDGTNVPVKPRQPAENEQVRTMPGGKTRPNIKRFTRLAKSF